MKDSVTAMWIVFGGLAVMLVGFFVVVGIWGD
jgi:hypothetical protein